MFAADAPVALDPADERSERHTRILQRLAEIGMNLAEAVDVQRQEDGADASELAMKFARIAKAVRQTLALEARLADDDRVRRDAANARRKIEQAHATRKAKEEGLFRKAQAGYMLEKALLREAPDLDTEPYTNEIAEWLFDDSDAELYADRPVDEIISEICRLLCLPGGWLAPDVAPPDHPAPGDADRPSWSLRDTDDTPDPVAGRPAQVEVETSHPP